MELSRNVEHGSLVTWRGDKIILASKGSRITGIYNRDSRIKGFTLTGESFSFEIPAGVRTYGEAEIRWKS